MNQKWHTTINWMDHSEIAEVLSDYGNLPRDKNLREVLRKAVMSRVIPTSKLERFIPWDKSHTWER